MEKAIKKEIDKEEKDPKKKAEDDLEAEKDTDDRLKKVL